jgi:hypothetical protein
MALNYTRIVEGPGPQQIGENIAPIPYNKSRYVEFTLGEDNGNRQSFRGFVLVTVNRLPRTPGERSYEHEILAMRESLESEGEELTGIHAIYSFTKRTGRILSLNPDPDIFSRERTTRKEILIRLLTEAIVMRGLPFLHQLRDDTLHRLRQSFEQEETWDAFDWLVTQAVTKIAPEQRDWFGPITGRALTANGLFGWTMNGDLYGPGTCETPSCKKETNTVYLTPEELWELNRQFPNSVMGGVPYGPEVLWAIFEKKSGTFLCEDCAGPCTIAV